MCRCTSSPIGGQPCPDDPTESDVSVDRRAARGHETLDKGHACPLGGKSSMHSFPAIVLQPGAQISLVQVELFPSYALSLSTSLLLTFLFPLIHIQFFFSLFSPLFHFTLTLSPLFILWLNFSSHPACSCSHFLRLPLSLCFSLSHDNGGILASR